MDTKPLTAKALGALLRQAKAFDIVELEIPGQVKFRRAPAAPVAAVRAAPGDGIDLDMVEGDVPDPMEEEGDPRFLMEKIAKANRKPRSAS